MYRHKHFTAFLGVLACIMCITACSSRDLSESQTSASEIQEAQSETSEPKEQKEEVPMSEMQENDSPENIIKAYLAGLRDSDVERMKDTFAENSYAKPYIPVGGDAAVFLDDTRRLPDTGVPSLDFYQDMAVEDNEDDIENDILRQYMILCDLDIDTKKAIVLDGDREAELFFKRMRDRMEEADFRTMKLLGFISQEVFMDRVDSDRYKDYLDGTAQIFKADTVESRQCVIELDGNKYVLVFELAEYDGKWKMLRLGGYSATMMEMDESAAGTEKMSAEDVRAYDKHYEQLMVPAGELPQTSGIQEDKALPDWESDGFDTPQEAVKAYLDGMKACDLESAVSTFAVESYVDHFDMQKDLEYIRDYYFGEQPFDLPPATKLSRELNILTRKRNITEGIAEQYENLCFINGVYFGNATVIEEETPEDMLQNRREMARVLGPDTIKILGYIPSEDLIEKYASEPVRDILHQRALRCGAEQVTSSIVAFELQGNPYYLCTDVIKYNGRWYNWQLGGQLAALLNLDYRLNGIAPLESLEGTELESLIVPME